MTDEKMVEALTGARNTRPTSREALELALRSTLDDDDAVSAAQIVLGEGWRPPDEVERLRAALQRFAEVPFDNLLGVSVREAARLALEADRG